jgi:methyl-accepting chemotaxis protein
MASGRANQDTHYENVVREKLSFEKARVYPMKGTIRNKLIGGLSGLLILIAAVACIGAYALRSLRHDAHDATTVGDRLNSIALEIQVHNLEAQRRVRSYLAAIAALGPKKAREMYLEEADFEIHEMDTLFAKAVAISPTAEKRAKFAKIGESLTFYKSALDRAVTAAEKGSNAAVRGDAEAQYELAADKLHDNAEDGEVAGREASETSEANIERTSSRAFSLSMGISVIGLLGGIGMSIVLLRAILLPVNHLREVAENVSMGNLQIEVRRFSDDEIGDLSDSFSRMLTAVRFFRMEAAMVQEEAQPEAGGYS